MAIIENRIPLSKTEFQLKQAFKTLNTIKRYVVLTNCNDAEMLRAVLSLELNLRSIQSENRGDINHG